MSFANHSISILALFNLNPTFIFFSYFIYRFLYIYRLNRDSDSVYPRLIPFLYNYSRKINYLG